MYNHAHSITRGVGHLPSYEKKTLGLQRCEKSAAVFLNQCKKKIVARHLAYLHGLRTSERIYLKISGPSLLKCSHSVATLSHAESYSVGKAETNPKSYQALEDSPHGVGLLWRCANPYPQSSG